MKVCPRIEKTSLHPSPQREVGLGLPSIALAKDGVRRYLHKELSLLKSQWAKKPKNPV